MASLSHLNKLLFVPTVNSTPSVSPPSAVALWTKPLGPPRMVTDFARPATRVRAVPSDAEWGPEKVEESYGGGGGVAVEEFVVDNRKNIYFAGYETTAVTAAWCMMLLALHPEWQDLVRDEACAAGAAPDFASLHKMKKVNFFIRRTTRQRSLTVACTQG